MLGQRGHAGRRKPEGSRGPGVQDEAELALELVARARARYAARLASVINKLGSSAAERVRRYIDRPLLRDTFPNAAGSLRVAPDRSLLPPDVGAEADAAAVGRTASAAATGAADATKLAPIAETSSRCRPTARPSAPAPGSSGPSWRLQRH
jgi:hypothetical protein